MCVPIDSTIQPTMEQIQSTGVYHRFQPFRAKSLQLRSRLRSLRRFHLLQIPWPGESEHHQKCGQVGYLPRHKLCISAKRNAFEATDMGFQQPKIGVQVCLKQQKHVKIRVKILELLTCSWTGGIYLSRFKHPTETCKLIDGAWVEPLSQRFSRPKTTAGAPPILLWCLRNPFKKIITKTRPNRPSSLPSSTARFTRALSFHLLWLRGPFHRHLGWCCQHGHFFSQNFGISPTKIVRCLYSAQMGCSPIFWAMIVWSLVFEIWAARIGAKSQLIVKTDRCWVSVAKDIPRMVEHVMGSRHQVFSGSRISTSIEMIAEYSWVWRCQSKLPSYLGWFPWMQWAPQQTFSFESLEIPADTFTGARSLVALFLGIVAQNHSLLAIVIFRFHLARNWADVFGLV